MLLDAAGLQRPARVRHPHDALGEDAVAVDDEAVAFIVALTNLNEAIEDFNGRLDPINLAKLLWRLKIAGVGSARVPLMGVVKRLQEEAKTAYIDDTGSITMMELRSKARRLKAREPGLGMIIVDYLQLMSGRRTENRVQEISEISRGLKGLARELNVPSLEFPALARSVYLVRRFSRGRPSRALASSMPVALTVP